MMEQPLGNFDPDLADVLCEATGELGIDLRTRAKVLKIDKNGTGFTVTYETPKETEVIDCDLVVHATGRVPNIDHLNLDAAGVEYSRSEEHTSELQSLMRISYAVFCLKKKKNNIKHKQPPCLYSHHMQTNTITPIESIRSLTTTHLNPHHTK